MYADFYCPTKDLNSEAFVLDANYVTKRLRENGLSLEEPHWVGLWLDGRQARTSTKVMMRAGESVESFVIVEHDLETVETLKEICPENCGVVYSEMQKYVADTSLQSFRYNLVFLDWMCTLDGNQQEGSPLAAVDVFLSRCVSEHLVLAQTFCLRGKGTEEEKKLRFRRFLSEAAFKHNYTPLWRGLTEKVYRRTGGGVPMLFSCVILIKHPTPLSHPAYIALYHESQVHAMSRYVTCGYQRLLYQTASCLGFPRNFMIWKLSNRNPT